MTFTPLSFTKILALSVLALITLSLTACGQKGPLEVESDPQIQAEPQEITK